MNSYEELTQETLEKFLMEIFNRPPDHTPEFTDLIKVQVWSDATGDYESYLIGNRLYTGRRGFLEYISHGVPYRLEVNGEAISNEHYLQLIC